MIPKNVTVLSGTGKVTVDGVISQWHCLTSWFQSNLAHKLTKVSVSRTCFAHILRVNVFTTAEQKKKALGVGEEGGGGGAGSLLFGRQRCTKMWSFFSDSRPDGTGGAEYSGERQIQLKIRHNFQSITKLISQATKAEEKKYIKKIQNQTRNRNRKCPTGEIKQSKNFKLHNSGLGTSTSGCLQYTALGMARWPIRRQRRPTGWGWGRGEGRACMLPSELWPPKAQSERGIPCKAEHPGSRHPKKAASRCVIILSRQING